LLPSFVWHLTVNSTADLLSFSVSDNFGYHCSLHFDSGEREETLEGAETIPVNEVCDLFCKQCVCHEKGKVHCGHYPLCKDCVKLFWGRTTCPVGHTLYTGDRARPRRAYEDASRCAFQRAQLV